MQKREQRHPPRLHRGSHHARRAPLGVPVRGVGVAELVHVDAIVRQAHAEEGARRWRKGLVGRAEGRAAEQRCVVVVVAAAKVEDAAGHVAARKLAVN